MTSQIFSHILYFTDYNDYEHCIIPFMWGFFQVPVARFKKMIIIMQALHIFKWARQTETKKCVVSLVPNVATPHVYIYIYMKSVAITTMEYK